MNRLQKKKISIVLLLLLAIISCFEVTYPKDVLINHIGTVIILLILAYDISTDYLTFSAYLWIAVFCVFHIAGAHWLYSYVPYNDWSKSWFGWDINASFGFNRNHYDRFVHLISGVLFYPYLNEYYTRKSKINFKTAVFVSWLAIQTLGMLYELLEWFASVILSPESTENYNGQQGDVWDAQKDMALALLSSTIMYFYYRYKIHNHKTS
jgi:putative membrane protein